MLILACPVDIVKPTGIMLVSICVKYTINIMFNIEYISVVAYPGSNASNNDFLNKNMVKQIINPEIME